MDQQAECQVSPWLPDVVVSSIRSKLEDDETATERLDILECGVNKNGVTSDATGTSVPPRKLWLENGDMDLIYLNQRLRELERQAQERRENRLRTQENQ